ncbi:MAG: hypothetical protein ABS44_01155 [Chryseobacterium sp. SCN 40-13]|nr:MAG: hypothetical protein ABS44_01155 [Chryseobacterium sp. SCN 40-13]
MKFILLTILSTIIIFFVWNILKRLFFNQFYKNIHQNPFGKPEKKEKSKIDKKVKWDAETVEYEEIKDPKNTQ